MNTEGLVLFFVFIFFYILNLILALIKRIAKLKIPQIDPNCPYQQTSFLDFPVFSMKRGINPVDPSSDLLALSGGGGGIEYGVPNRLEIYTRSSCLESNKKITENGTRRIVSLMEMMSSTLMLGVVDDIRFNPLRNIFIGGCCRDCLVFRVNPVSQCTEVVYRWETIPTPPPGTRDTKVQERCAISPDGTLVATAGEDGLLRLYLLLYDENGIVYGHRNIASIAELVSNGYADLMFTPDNNLLFCICRDGSIRVIGPFHASLLPNELNPNDDCFPEFKILSTIRLPLPSGVQAPRFSGSNPCITLRHIQWLGEQSKSTLKNGYYVCALTGHVTNSKVSLLYKLEIFTRIPLASEKGEATVDYKEECRIIKKACPMFNCLAVSDDFQKIAVVSNTQFYIFNANSLRAEMEGPRSVATESDLPATGCAFINKGKELVITAGDFGLTTINLAAAAAATGGFIRTALIIVYFFIKLILVVSLAAIGAIVISSLRQGMFGQLSADQFRELQFEQLNLFSTEVLTKKSLDSYYQPSFRSRDNESDVHEGESLPLHAASHPVLQYGQHIDSSSTGPSTTSGSPAAHSYRHDHHDEL